MSKSFLSFPRIICPICKSEMFAEQEKDSLFYRHMEFPEIGINCSRNGRKYKLPTIEILLEEIK